MPEMTGLYFFVNLVFWLVYLQPTSCYQNFFHNDVRRMHPHQMGAMRHPYLAVNQPVIGRTNPHFQDRVKDFMTIEHAPKNISTNTVLKIKYQCSRPLVIALFIDGYENQDGIMRNSIDPLLVNDPEVMFKKVWKCSYTNDPIHRSIRLWLPPRFLYRPSMLITKASVLEDIHLKIFMAPLNEWNFVKAQKKVSRNRLHVLYERMQKKLNISLSLPNPFDRSELEVEKCNSWQKDILNSITKKHQMKSLAEEECSTIVQYPIVMSEEPYGVIKGFYPFYNPELKRKKASRQLRFTLTMEAYIFTHCEKSNLCSFFHHLDNNDAFETPLVLMNAQGHIHVQAKLGDNGSYAHTTPWIVPLNQWVRLCVTQTNALTNITLLHGEEFSQKMTFSVRFHKSVLLKEKEGYMVVGGTMYCKNLNAIVSHTKFCRNKVVTIDKIKFPEKTAPVNDKFLKSYKRQQKSLIQSVKRRWRAHLDTFTDIKTNICIPFFLEIIQNVTKHKDSNAQCPLVVEDLKPHMEDIEKIVKEFSTSFKSNEVVTKTGEALYKTFLERLEDQDALSSMTTNMKLLRQSARLGYSLSHFLLYSIFKNGITVKRNFVKARFHLLAGARLGDRMCLKAIAYNHLNGICGFPVDVDLSFFYYFNLAHKTQQDLTEHSEDLAAVNYARLTDERQMKQQLSEGDDLFQWFKHQASKGAYSAQRNMGRLLYWGQQGLQRNLNAAFKYYEEAAKGGDPVAMYDYGLILLKGHGTNADTAKGVEVLRQAAEVENPAALNTLGWYYTAKEVNMTKAMEYFEKADRLGSIDAAYNLGHTHHTGKYPGKKRDMKMAFTKYYRAASGGHTEASLQVAYLTATGIEGFLHRNAFSAVQWAKYLADRSPTMGGLVREGLQAYRKQKWAKALFLYLSIADTGFEVAQYNTAFLCESEANDLTHHIEEECVWKNWNISSQMRNPHPYALNKMGDCHYYGHSGEEDLKKSISYYGYAAKLNYPQALFNLASIMEKHGNVIENSTLKDLALPEEAFQSPEDAIVHLYKKCTAVASSETSTPCYIALVRTQTILMWNRTSLLAKITTFAVIIITTVVLVLINLCRKRRVEERRPSCIVQEERLENGSINSKQVKENPSPEETPNSPADLEESDTLEEEKE